MRTFVSLTVLTLLIACSSIAQDAPRTQTVAEVDGEKITLQDLRQASGQSLAALEEEAFRLQQQKLEQLIGERLIEREARRRKTTVDAMVETEIAAKVPAITPQEVHSFYEANRAQLQKPETELAEPIRTYLREQRIAARRREFVKSLQAQAKINVYLTPPEPFRSEVNGSGPTRGAGAAPITIVVFEDFHCPYCKQVNDTLDRVAARYKDQVKVVHRDFPIPSLHPTAWKAHEAARCAEKQGKFWEYRNLLYANPPAGTSDQLTRYATQLALDLPAFKQCTDASEFKAIVQKDTAEGERLGISGTPAFFINGRLLSGSQPEAEFVRVIDEELNRKTGAVKRQE
jgi:protein-disulfide isomerase